MQTSFISRHSQPYYTSKEINYLSVRFHGSLGLTRAQQLKSSACELISAVANTLGFPQRTICTASLLYHRFHLLHSYKDFSQPEVCAACLFVSCKIEDTLKKTPDIILALHSVRFSMEMDQDSNSFVDVRKRVLFYERLILETVCFDFQIRHPFNYVVKFSRKLFFSYTPPKCNINIPEITAARISWKISCDAYKCNVCLMFPPHVIAGIGIYLATLVQKSLPRMNEEWWKNLYIRVQDIEDGAHEMLDLYEFEQGIPEIVKHEMHAVDITQLKISINAEKQERMKRMKGMKGMGYLGPDLDQKDFNGNSNLNQDLGSEPPPFRYSKSDVDVVVMESSTSNKDITRRFLFAE